MASLKNMQKVWKMMISSGGFDSLLNKATLVSVGEGRCVCKMKVEKEHTNLGSTLHGGLTATMVDTVSTLALLASEPHKPGVSVDLSVSYLRAAALGEELTIDAKASKVGKSLSFLTVDIMDSKGRLVAQGKHTKFVGGEMNFREVLTDGEAV